MVSVAVPVEDEGERLLAALEEAIRKVDAAESDIVLDFAWVRRMDANAERAMKQLADAADDKKVKIVLRGIDAEVYRVLKLLELARRFFFAN